MTPPPRTMALQARRLGLSVAASVLVPVALATTFVTNVGGCATCGPTFAEAFRASSVVTVSFVLAAAANGSTTLQTERVLKGSAPSLRTYPPDDKAAHLTAGTRIVLLGGADTLDFRGVWVLLVNGDGTLDSGGLRDAPRTLAELEALLALPETATVAFGTAPERRTPSGPLVAMGVALLLLAGALLRRVRPARGPA